MNQFKYLRAESVREACELLSQYGDEGKILAGGQSLVFMMKENLVCPSYVIDIKGIADLDYIRCDTKDGLQIGALTTHRSLEKSPLVQEKFAMLAEMERTLASVAIRNWGTVGGSLAHADPASDLAPALVALGAEVTLIGPGGERVVRMDDFCVDYFETALQPAELVTEIRVPSGAESGGGFYYKFARRAADSAIVSVAVWLTLDPGDRGVCQDIRIVMGSVGPTALRSTRAEDLLRGQALGDGSMEAAARLAAEDAQPTTDVDGSEEYKREIIPVLVQRSIQGAAARALAA